MIERRKNKDSGRIKWGNKVGRKGKREEEIC
jgi:hypothetical protein